MKQMVKINDKNLPIKEYDGQRVVTFKDIDTVHERSTGSARRNFNTNKKHFIKGTDYFVRNSYEAQSEYGIAAPNGLTLITETGYLMLVKSFTDDLAWTVQRQLVNGYFKAKQLSDYEPKSTSAGEVASLLRILVRDMKDQGHSPETVSAMIEKVCGQFGIGLPKNYVKPNPYQQITFIVQQGPLLGE